MSLPAEFASPAAFHQAYTDGLVRMLAGDSGLGSYILVLANAANDANLWQLLEHRLEERFYHLCALVVTALRQGRTLTQPEDDLMVLLKLMAMGFNAVTTADARTAGPWEVLFNPLRALRPTRGGGGKLAGATPAAFNPKGFHFDQPFLRPEVFWEGTLLEHPARLLYNKFPFAPLHGLLVPEPARHLPQLLSPALHGWAWELAARAGETLPGFGLGYNSHGAYSSVNHLHFQSYLRDLPLPVASPRWRHNGGAQAYPARCQTYTDPLESWDALDALHCQDRPYNLVYTPGKLYLLPRRPQGSYRHSPWSNGHAWYEMAGGVTALSQEDYNQMEAPAIEAELRVATAV